MAAAFLALPSLGLAVVVVLLLPLMTAHTVPLLLPICKEVSGGGEGGSCWAEERTALPDVRSGGWQRQPDAGGSPRTRSPWPTWLWGTAFSSCLVTLPAPGPPIQTRDDRRPRWLHLSDLRGCSCQRSRAPSACLQLAPTDDSFSLRLYDHRSATRSANVARMTTTKGPWTHRRVAGTEPGTPACSTSCTRHYWLIVYPFHPDSHTPLIIRLPERVKTHAREWNQRDNTREIEDDNMSWHVPYHRREDTRQRAQQRHWCWDAILLPSRDHADSLNATRRNPPQPPCCVIRPYIHRAMAAPRRTYWVVWRDTEIGKGWWRRLSVQSETETEADQL